MSQPPPVKSSPFATDVLKLVTGTTIAQIIAILASPILTRLFGPEAFGFFALFTSITAIIGVIACMRYELAIMLPEDDEAAANLLALSFLMVAIISGLTAIGLYFGGEIFVTFLQAPGLSPYLWIVPPFIFMSGIFLALNYWNSRTRNFGRLSIARITRSIATSGTQLAAGFAGFVTGGSLISASLVGSVVSTGILGGQIWREDQKHLKHSISWQGMIEGLKRYKRFPLLDSGSALLNSISWQLPVLLLSAFFSPVIVGFYAIGMRVLQTPMSLIGGSIAQVFFQRASEARRDGMLNILVENVFKVLVLIGLFPLLILTFIGGDIFLVIFGDQWLEAGIYAQILGIWTFIWFISSPLSTLYIVLEKQDFGLKYNIANLITRLLSLVIGGFIGSVYIALTLFAISGIGVYGYLCISMLRFSGVSWLVVKKILLSNLVIFTPVGIILICLKIFNFKPIFLVTIATISLIVYYMYILKTDAQVQAVCDQLGLSRYFKRIF